MTQESKTPTEQPVAYSHNLSLIFHLILIYPAPSRPPPFTSCLITTPAQHKTCLDEMSIICDRVPATPGEHGLKGDTIGQA